MGSDESSIQASEKASYPIISGQILISVHGSSGSGKTTLINHLVKKSFDSQYFPTKQMESRQILWKSIQKPNETIRIIVWDVVEKTTTSPRPVDTISRADGIILIYNPDDEYSVEYALSILYKIPIEESNEKSKIPVLILSNFLDLRENHLKVHPRLANSPYPQIQISLKTGFGLDVCEKWLDRAFLYNNQRSLDARLQSVRREKDDLVIAIRSTIYENENNLKSKRRLINPVKETAKEATKKISLPIAEHTHYKTSMPPLSQLLEAKKEEETSNDQNESNKNKEDEKDVNNKSDNENNSNDNKNEDNGNDINNNENENSENNVNDDIGNNDQNINYNKENNSNKDNKCNEDVDSNQDHDIDDQITTDHRQSNDNPQQKEEQA